MSHNKRKYSELEENHDFLQNKKTEKYYKYCLKDNKKVHSKTIRKWELRLEEGKYSKFYAPIGLVRENTMCGDICKRYNNFEARRFMSYCRRAQKIYL